MKFVIEDVVRERVRQDKKWGPQNHNTFKWLAILGEEVGEVNQAALENHFGGKKTLEDYVEELIQTAAVAVAAVECIKRNESLELQNEATLELAVAEAKKVRAAIAMYGMNQAQGDCLRVTLMSLMAKIYNLAEQTKPHYFENK